MKNNEYISSAFNQIAGRSSAIFSAKNVSVQHQISELQNEMRTVLDIEQLPEKTQEMMLRFIETTDRVKSQRLEHLFEANTLMADQLHTQGYEPSSPAEKHLKHYQEFMKNSEQMSPEQRLSETLSQIKIMAVEIEKLKKELYLFEEDGPHKALEIYFDEFEILKNNIERALSKKLNRTELHQVGLQISEWQLAMGPLLENISSYFETVVDPLTHLPKEGVKAATAISAVSSAIIASLGLAYSFKSQLIFAAEGGNNEWGRAMGVLSTSSFILYNYLMSGFQGIVFKYSFTKEHQFGRLMTRPVEFVDKSGKTIKALVKNIRRMPSSAITSFSNTGFKNTTNLMVFLRQSFIEGLNLNIFKINNDSSSDYRYEIKGLEIYVKRLQAKAQLFQQRLTVQSEKQKLGYSREQIAAFAFDLAVKATDIDVTSKDILLDAAQDAGMHSGQCDYIWHVTGLDGGERSIYSGFRRHFDQIKNSAQFKDLDQSKLELYFSKFLEHYRELTIKNIYDIEEISKLMEKFLSDSGLPAAHDTFWKNRKQDLALLLKVPHDDIKKRFVEMITEGAKIGPDIARKFVDLLEQKSKREVATIKIGEIGNRLSAGLLEEEDFENLAILASDRYGGDKKDIKKMLTETFKDDSIERECDVLVNEDNVDPKLLNEAIDLSEAMMFKARNKEEVGVPGFYYHKFQHLQQKAKSGIELNDIEKEVYKKMLSRKEKTSVNGKDELVTLGTKNSEADMKHRFMRYAHFDFHMAPALAAELINPLVQNIAENGLSGVWLSAEMEKIALERKKQKLTVLGDDILRMEAFQKWRGQRLNFFNYHAQEILERHNAQITDPRARLAGSQVYLLEKLLSDELEKMFLMQVRVAKGLVHSIKQNDVALHALAENLPEEDLTLQKLTDEIRQTKTSEKNIIEKMMMTLGSGLIAQLEGTHENIFGKHLAEKGLSLDIPFLEVKGKLKDEGIAKALDAEIKKIKELASVLQKKYSLKEFVQLSSVSEFSVKDSKAAQLLKDIEELKKLVASANQNIKKIKEKGLANENFENVLIRWQERVDAFALPQAWSAVEAFLSKIQTLQSAFYEDPKKLSLQFNNMIRTRFRNLLDLSPEQLTTQMVDFLFGEGEIRGSEPLNNIQAERKEINEVIYTDMQGNPLSTAKHHESLNQYRDLIQKKEIRENDFGRYQYLKNQIENLTDQRAALNGKVKINEVRYKSKIKLDESLFKNAETQLKAATHELKTAQPTKEKLLDGQNRHKKDQERISLELQKLKNKLNDLDATDKKRSALVMQIRDLDRKLKQIKFLTAFNALEIQSFDLSQTNTTNLSASQKKVLEVKQQALQAKQQAFIWQRALQREMTERHRDAAFQEIFKQSVKSQSQVMSLVAELDGALSQMENFLKEDEKLEALQKKIQNFIKEPTQTKEAYLNFLETTDPHYLNLLKELKTPAMAKAALFDELSRAPQQKMQMKSALYDLVQVWQKQYLQLENIEQYCQTAANNTKPYREIQKKWIDKLAEYQKLDHQIGLKEKNNEELAVLEKDGNIQLKTKDQLNPISEDDYARLDALKNELHQIRGQIGDLGLLSNLSSFPIAIEIFKKIEPDLKISINELLGQSASSKDDLLAKKTLFQQINREAIARDQKMYGIGTGEDNASLLNEIAELSGHIFVQHQDQLSKVKKSQKEINFYELGKHYHKQKTFNYQQLVFYEYMDFDKRWGGFKANNLESETGATVYEWLSKLLQENIKEVAENQPLDFARLQTALNLGFCKKIEFDEIFADVEELKFDANNGFAPDVILKDILMLRMNSKDSKAMTYEEAKNILFKKWTNQLLTQRELLERAQKLEEAATTEAKQKINDEYDAKVTERRERFTAQLNDPNLEKNFKDISSEAVISSYTGYYLGQFSALFMLAGKLPTTSLNQIPEEAIEDYLKPVIQAIARSRYVKGKGKSYLAKNLEEASAQQEISKSAAQLFNDFSLGKLSISQTELVEVTLNLKSEFGKKSPFYEHLSDYEKEEIQGELQEKLRYLHDRGRQENNTQIKENREKGWLKETFYQKVSHMPEKLRTQNEEVFKELLKSIKKHSESKMDGSLSFKPLIEKTDENFKKFYAQLEREFQMGIVALEQKFADYRDYHQKYFGPWYTFAYQMQPEAIVGPDNNATTLTSYFNDRRLDEKGNETLFGRSPKRKMYQGPGEKRLREFMSRPGWRQNDAIDFEQWNARKRSMSRMPEIKRERSAEFPCGSAMDQNARFLNFLIKKGEIKLGGSHPHTEAEILKVAADKFESLEIFSEILSEKKLTSETKLTDLIQELSHSDSKALKNIFSTLKKRDAVDFKDFVRRVKEFAAYGSELPEGIYKNYLNRDHAFQYIDIIFPQHLKYEIDTDNGLFESRVDRFRNEFKLGPLGKILRAWQVALGGMQKIQESKELLQSMQNWNGGVYQRVMGRVFDDSGVNGFMGCYLTMNARLIDLSKVYFRSPKLQSDYIEFLQDMTGNRDRSKVQKDWLYYLSFGARRIALPVVIVTSALQTITVSKLMPILSAAGVIGALRGLHKSFVQERIRGYENTGTLWHRHKMQMKEGFFAGIKTGAAAFGLAILGSLALSLPAFSAALAVSFVAGFAVGMIGQPAIKAIRENFDKYKNRSSTDLPESTKKIFYKTKSGKMVWISARGTSNAIRNNMRALTAHLSHKGPWILTMAIMAWSAGTIGTLAMPALGVVGMIAIADIALGYKFKDKSLSRVLLQKTSGLMSANKAQSVRKLLEVYENSRVIAGARLALVSFTLIPAIFSAGTGLLPVMLAGLFAMLILPRITRVLRAKPGQVNKLVGSWFAPTTGFMALSSVAGYGLMTLLFPSIFTPAVLGIGVVAGIVGISGAFSSLAVPFALRLRDPHTRKRYARVMKTALTLISKGPISSLMQLGYQSEKYRSMMEGARVANQQFKGHFAVGVNWDSEDLITTFMVLLFGLESAFHGQIDGLSGALSKLERWVGQMVRWRGGGIAAIRASSAYIKNYNQIRDRDALRMLFRLTFNTISLPRAALMFASSTFLMTGGMVPSFMFMDSAFFKDSLIAFAAMNNLNYSVFLRMFYGALEQEGAPFPIVRNILNSNELLSSLVTKNVVGRGYFGDSADFMVTTNMDRAVKQDLDWEYFTPNYLFSGMYTGNFLATSSFILNNGSMPAWFMSTMLFWTMYPVGNFATGLKDLATQGSLTGKQYEAVSQAQQKLRDAILDTAMLTQEDAENLYQRMDHFFKKSAHKQIGIDQRQMRIAKLREYISEQKNALRSLRADLFYNLKLPLVRRNIKINLHNHWYLYGLKHVFKSVMNIPFLPINVLKKLRGQEKFIFIHWLNQNLRKKFGMSSDIEYYRLRKLIQDAKKEHKLLKIENKAEKKKLRESGL